MFYNKKIDILTTTNGSTNEYGMYVEGTETIKATISCDVQPITRELALKEFGYEDDVEYRVFCGITSDIDTGVMVNYNNARYKVIKLMIWDDYMDVLLDKVR